MRVRMRPSCSSELHARLLQQQRFVLARQVVERALQADVKSAADSARPRESCCSVEKRSSSSGSKSASPVVVLALVARDDLRFGFDVEAAQLVAQTRVGLLHFGHRAAERAELLFQARAVDRDFAGVVDQAVEQVGADAHLFLRRAHADVVVVADRLRSRSAPTAA